jgi:hypothetical protein
MSDESQKEEIKDEIHQFQDSEQEELEDDDEEGELEVDDEDDDFEDEKVGLTETEEKNTSSENAT